MRWHLPVLVLASALPLGCSCAEHCRMSAQQAQQPVMTAATSPCAADRQPQSANVLLANYEQPNDEAQPADEGELLPPVLELWELEEMALASNPAIAVARARMQAAGGRWIQVGLPPNPVVGYSGQQLGSAGEAEQQGVLIGQELITGKKLRLDRQVAAQEVDRAEQQLAAVQTRVITDVRISYFEVAIAQRQMKLAQQLLDVGERGLQAADALLAAQEASRLDVLQMSVERDSAKVLLVNARNRLDAAWRQLAAVIGQPELPAGTVADDLQAGPPVQWEHALERLLSQSPEVAAAMSNISRARWAVNRAEAEVIPNVTVEGVVQQDNATGSSNGNLQVTLPVPVWNRNQGGIQEALSELSAAEYDLERTQLRLERELAVVYERYLNALEQVQRFEQDILPKAQESLDLVVRGYEGGEFDYLRLLTAQRTFFQTSGTYLDALRQWKTAEAEMDGLLLAGALAER